MKLYLSVKMAPRTQIGGMSLRVVADLRGGNFTYMSNDHYLGFLLGST